MADKEGSFLDAFIFGGIIGAALAVLFTPITGEDARKKIKEKIDEVKDTQKDTIENIKENTPELVAKTMQSIEEGIANLSVAIEEAKTAVGEKRKEMGGE